MRGMEREGKKEDSFPSFHTFFLRLILLVFSERKGEKSKRMGMEKEGRYREGMQKMGSEECTKGGHLYTCINDQ